MEGKNRSKDSGWECCYTKKKFGTFGVEMRACGHKLVKFRTLTHAAKLVVEINYIGSGLSRSALKCQKGISVKETEGSAK